VFVSASRCGAGIMGTASSIVACAHKQLQQRCSRVLVVGVARRVEFNSLELIGRTKQRERRGRVILIVRMGNPVRRALSKEYGLRLWAPRET
jgi:hypothetical protein